MQLKQCTCTCVRHATHFPPPTAQARLPSAPSAASPLSSFDCLPPFLRSSSLSFLLPPHPSRTSSDNCLPSTRKASRKKLCSQSCVQPVANCRARCSFLDRSLHSRIPRDEVNGFPPPLEQALTVSPGGAPKFYFKNPFNGPILGPSFVRASGSQQDLSKRLSK